MKTPCARFTRARLMPVTLSIFVTLLCLNSLPLLSQPVPAEIPRDTLFKDFDHDGSIERLTSRPGFTQIEHWNVTTKTWEKSEYTLPEGLTLVDENGKDTGLRFIDLNGDGFDDILFSNQDRMAIHLWNKNVRPELSWTRGWSQFVRSGVKKELNSDLPSLVDAKVASENGDLVITLPGPTVASKPRFNLKQLVAFDMPPPKSPQEALQSFKLPPGFRIELVASEPMVTDPVAFDWGADGRLWVVEMRDYPLGMDDHGKPGGRVKILDSPNDQGQFQRMTLFMDEVAFPNSVMPWGKGALIATAPNLIYAEDSDGDGKADVFKTLFTGFVEGNQQHRFNGFEWGLDGWIYVANGDSGGKIQSLLTGKTLSISGRDFRFKPDTGEMETVSAQTQYGRRRDDWGHWFGNNNPTWLWHVTLPEHYLKRNPKLAVKRVSHILANYENSTRVFPISKPMIRPNQSWSLNHVTSGCSPAPYRDDLFGPDFASSVFACEPVHNVVHREVLEPQGSGLMSHRAPTETQSEFLASTDNWFRPVQAKTGPDGALYIADMYRFILEHPEWISPEMLARVDIHAGRDKGRIYRIVPEGATRRTIPNMAVLSMAQLVSAMDSVNGWQRDMAQRILVSKKVPSMAGPLRDLLKFTHAPQVRVQAMATLGLINLLDAPTLIQALKDPHPGVRCEALRQTELATQWGQPLFQAIQECATDGEDSVRLQAAFSLGAWPVELSEPVLRALAAREDSDDLIRTAVLSSLQPESALFRELNQQVRVTNQVSMATLKPSSPDRARVIAGYKSVEGTHGNPQRGQKQFQTLCAPCHRTHSEGHSVGPDLGMVASKPVDWLLNAILDPSQAIEARYRAWTVHLKSGEEWSGLLSVETANNIVLKMPGGVEQPILKSEISQMIPMKISLMPNGFESALKPEDMADLISWLRAP